MQTLTSLTATQLTAAIRERRASSLDVVDAHLTQIAARDPALNPIGVKGAGEAGAIPEVPLFAQALENALGIEGFEITEIPLSPSRLWELVEGANDGESTEL